MSADLWTWILNSGILQTLLGIIVGSFIGYWLGLKSGKIQILRNYIKETVNKHYPRLYSEIKQRSDELDNFLDKPFEFGYNFPALDDIYNSGLIGFIEKHHPLLFEKVESFKREVVPGYKKLYNLLRERVTTNIISSWTNYLKEKCNKSDPYFDLSTINNFVSNLISTVSDYLILPFLFKYAENREDFERDVHSHLNHAFDREEIPIYGDDRKKVIQELLIRAEPETKNLLEYYQNLIRINDKITKTELLPLIKKYIGDPLAK